MPEGQSRVDDPYAWDVVDATVAATGEIADRDQWPDKTAAPATDVDDLIDAVDAWADQ